MIRHGTGGSARALQLVTSANRRGAEVFAVDLAHGLAQLDVPVDTVALGPGSGVAPLNIEVLGRRSRSLRTTAHLRRRVRDAAVVVAHGSATLPSAALGLWGTGVPFVYRSIGDIARWASNPVRSGRVRLFLRQADVVVALWEQAANDIVDRFGVPRERVQIIPNGVAAERFAPADPTRRRQHRAALGLPQGLPLAAYVGSLTPEKDVATSIEAVANLPNMHLAVVGNGPERQRLQALARVRAPGRVRFLGAVDDISSVLASADVLVLTSLTEGQPAVLIEGGMAGLPSVATDVGGVGSVVVDGVTGYLVPPRTPRAVAEGLEAVMERTEEMGSAARQHSLEAFSLDRVARRWRDVVCRYLT